MVEPREAGAGTSRTRALVEVVGLFLRLGLTAFGGPAAHIAMLEDEVVRRRQWLTREEFLDLLGATNLIPGPNSTELAIHIGYRRAGWPGFALAGLGFILPAMVLVTAIAWAYVRFGTLPRAGGLLAGVKPVILVVIVQALWSLAGKAVKSRFLAGVGVASVGLVLAGAHELAVLFGAGLVMALSG
ncbi:MAG: chromate transporter, partial [Verrucomicrobiales bacterium]|nr:chromate transporter [Verrucomicrobiales bacterium]